MECFGPIAKSSFAESESERPAATGVEDFGATDFEIPAAGISPMAS